MNSRFLAASALLVAVCVAAASAQHTQPQHAQSQHVQHGPAAAPRAAAAPHKPAPPGPLPPLPRVNFTPAMPMPAVQQVYEFAARHPEVLQYMPCYCGCERVGHGGNHDCFVKSRAASGRIAQWDEHGIGCAVCLQVGYRAMTLFNQKKTVAQIRDAIDREIGSRYPSSTPTPKPTGKRS